VITRALAQSWHRVVSEAEIDSWVLILYGLFFLTAMARVVIKTLTLYFYFLFFFGCLVLLFNVTKCHFLLG